MSVFSVIPILPSTLTAPRVGKRCLERGKMRIWVVFLFVWDMVFKVTGAASWVL